MRRGKAAQSEKHLQQADTSNEGEEDKSKPSYFDAVKTIGMNIV
jgi:hypothetical protein